MADTIQAEDHTTADQTGHKQHKNSALSHLADEIILIGHGKGNSNEAELLSEFLHKHNPTIGNRIIRVEDMDLSSLSEAGIERRLREH